MDIKAIFFDLDGTLLPMDQEQFTKGYFKELAGVLVPVTKLTPEALVAAVWDGTKAMVQNTGEQINADVFWSRFAASTGLDTGLCRPLCDRFYSNEFHRARRITGENPLAVKAVALAHGKGRKAILASNPIFPLVGQASRLSWVGLTPEDFDLVTSYESDRFCKPNPRYYTDICERLGLAPQECLMVGNDETEDMHAASAAGLRGWLVKDCRIPSEVHPWSGALGTFTELLEMLRERGGAWCRSWQYDHQPPEKTPPGRVAFFACGVVFSFLGCAWGPGCGRRGR